MPNQAGLTIPGRYAAIRDGCAFIVTAARGAGFQGQDLFHIELACDEACTNIIEHAYGGEDRGAIELSYALETNVIRIFIRDQGRAFAPDDIPRPPHLDPNLRITPAEIAALPVGGLGLHLIRQTMDDVNFEFTANGNVLTLVKKQSE